MSENWDNSYFDRVLAARNYIAAYQYIKRQHPPEPEYSEYSGSLVSAVIDELSKVNKREEPDRVVYLRSILSWVFRDIPGLSSLYREQLRGGSSGGDTVSEVYRGIRNMNDVASGRKSLGEGVEDAFEQMRDNFEKVAGELRERFEGFTRSQDRDSRSDSPDKGDESGPASNEGVNDFLRGAEHTITEGLRQIGNFFENARRNAETRSSGESHSATERDVKAEDESGATIRVDIVDDEEKTESTKGKHKKG